jgi:hypothetical protein
MPAEKEVTPTSFHALKTNYSLVSVLFDAVACEIKTAPLHNTDMKCNFTALLSRAIKQHAKHIHNIN